MANHYIYGYRPAQSPMYFYISISKDPQANFERDMAQEKNAYGQVQGNKEAIKRINYWNKQVKLDIIASTDEQDVAYALRNYLLYYCQKTVIFKGNQLTKENFVILGSRIKSLYKNRQFELLTTVGCFRDLLSIQQVNATKRYNNWPSDKDVPENWIVVDGYVVPEEFSEFMPPVEFITDGRIYLFDDTYWNLKQHKME